MTDAADDTARFAYLAITLPVAPPRQARGSWSSPVARAAYCVAILPAILLTMSFKEPGRWYAFGALLLVVILVVGPMRRIQKRRLAAERARRPGEPWLWDHDWDPSGTSLSTLGRMVLSAERRLTLRSWNIAAVLICLGLSSMIRDGLVWGPLTVVGAFVTWLAWKAWRLHGAGTAHVGYAKFPFHPGEPVVLRFGMSEGGATFLRAKFFLRRIGETQEAKQPAYASTKFELSETRPPGFLPGPDQFIELVFDVPENAVGTRLSEKLPRYWLLDVVAATSAGPYCESFLVPIYERPAGAAA